MQIKQNSWQAWLLATRPKTLAAGATPVIVASALAYYMGSFCWQPALLCLIFALLAQIASNFSNDYFDGIRKTDDGERLGPERAVAAGWISPRAMLMGTLLVIVLASAVGLGLVAYGGWVMIVVGVCCILSLLAYTAGPFPLAYNGLGDVFVFVFFGLTAVVCTFYLQTGYLHPLAFVLGSAVGLAAINILIVNNYRDREGDLRSRKYTTIVIFGEKFARYAYLINGVLAMLLCLTFVNKSFWVALLPLLYLPLHLQTWRSMCSRQGKELNKVLGHTARNLLILGLLISMGLAASRALF